MSDENLKEKMKKFYENIWRIKKNRYDKKLYLYPGSRIHVALSLLPKGDSLLDIGCGEGTLCYFAQEKMKSIIGIDISEEALKIANRFGIKTKLMDVNMGLDFRDEEFSCITCLDTLEHVIEPMFLLQDIKRVLKKKGTLILAVPNISYFRHLISLIRGKFPKTSDDLGYDGGHLHYFGIENFKAMLRTLNFRILNIKGVGGRGFLIKYLAPGFAIKCLKRS